MDKNHKNQSIHKHPPSKNVKLYRERNVSPSRKLPKLPLKEMRAIHVEAQSSVDSAYYGGTQCDDLESRPPSQRQLLSDDVFQQRHALRRSPSPSRRWMAVADTIRAKRKLAANTTKTKNDEMENLKLNYERCQSMVRKLEAENQPLKDELIKYEDKLLHIEDANHKQVDELKKLEVSHAKRYSEVVKEKQKLLQNNEILHFQFHKNLQEANRQLSVEKKLVEKELNEVREENNELKNISTLEQDDDDPRTKQLANLKTEILDVRHILETSERDRLNERKEKLSTIQNMIRLTKLKSDLEEELDERRKADTQGDNQKYTRLYEKYEVTIEKLSKLRNVEAQTAEEVEKKYLKEIHSLKKSHEEALVALKEEPNEINTNRKEKNEKDNDHCDTLMKDVNQDLPEIIDSLTKDGIYAPGETGKELLTKLFNQYQQIYQEWESSKDVVDNLANNDVKKIIHVLKEEKKLLKQYWEDTNLKLKATENESRIKETVYKQQINDLLGEKKKSHLKLQESLDQIENFEYDRVEWEGILKSKQEFLEKKLVEIEEFRENLLEVTSEMKTIDAEHGRTKRELAIKKAEISRLNQDYINEQIMLQKERKHSEKLAKDFEEKRNEYRSNEKKNALLQDKILNLAAELETYQSQYDRVTDDCDTLKDEIVALKTQSMSERLDKRKLEDDFQALQTQNEAMESSTKEKIKLLQTTTVELDALNIELCALKYLLTEEETKSNEYEHDIESLTVELQNQSNLITTLQDNNRQIEMDLKQLKEKYEDIEVDYHDNESSLREHASSNLLIEKELAMLQKRYNELVSDKKNLVEQVEKLNKMISEDGEDKESIEGKYSVLKKDLHDQNKKMNELTAEKKKVLEENSNLLENLKELQTSLSSIKNADSAYQEGMRKLKKENEKLLKDIEEKDIEIAALEREIKDVDNVMVTVEEPLQEAMVECNVESAVDMFGENTIPATTDTKVGKRWGLASSLGNVVARLKQAEVNAKRKHEENLVLRNQLQQQKDDVLLQQQVDELMKETPDKPLYEEILTEQQQVNVESSPPQSITELDVDTGKHWNDMLMKENEIKKLNNQLKLKNGNIKGLERQLELMEQKLKANTKIPNKVSGQSVQEQVKEIKNQLARERIERSEAVECLKAIVVDNDKLTHCVSQQQRALSKQERENKKLKTKVNELIGALEDQEHVLNQTKQQLEGDMKLSTEREGDVNKYQQQQLDTLKNEFEKLREEKRGIQLLLEDKTHELSKTEDDLNSLKSAIEYNLGCLEAEKRAKDVIEQQMGIIVQDRGFTNQKLKSTELHNKLLQVKLKSLQKWHNELEINLIKSRGYIEPINLTKDIDEIAKNNLYKESVLNKLSPSKNLYYLPVEKNMDGF